MAVVGDSADGNGVIDRATALKPDIVVMDLSMPGMNGLVATRTLKKAQPDVTIVALTGTTTTTIWKSSFEPVRQATC
jgi:DNA-binding NarL/FixJ family response regulator